MIDRVKKEDIKKDELKERFGLDDGQINDLLEEGKMLGSPYFQLPKFNLDVSSLQAADNIYLTNTHWEFTLLKQKMKNMFNLGDAKLGPLEISFFFRELGVL